MRRGVRRGTAAFAFVLMTACGGSPNRPGPQPPPPPPPPPANNVPVIESITVQGSRAQEPPSFADLSEIVEVTAQVRDDETSVDQLQFTWTASSGTFNGSGRRVTWQAPPLAETPSVVTLTLAVVERYGGSFEHRVTRNAEVALHDSVREVADMSRQFLLDFSDSTIRDVSFIMRNFDPGCYGTEQETEDVARNRRDLRITGSTIGPAAVTVRFGGTCPFRARPGDACAQIPASWSSVWVRDGSRAPSVRGTDQVAAMYQRAERRWRLCDSQFNGDMVAIMRQYFR
ncbi:MAG TPA: hypothetical protein VE379_11155 [Vicinamibacterales bacterium]|nr:hypothetical protein [Vicinamibacterales bacterium]